MWNTWLARVRLRPTPPAFNESRNSCGPRGSSWKRSTIAWRSLLRVPPCRKGTSDFQRCCIQACSRCPHSANWVNSRARSPASITSSRISSSRCSLAERPRKPSSTAPSLRARAGWLQICFSRVSRASTCPWRCPRGARAMASRVSSTVLLYRDFCSLLSPTHSLSSTFSGRSEMIVLSVFSRRRMNGPTRPLRSRRDDMSPYRSIGIR